MPELDLTARYPKTKRDHLLPARAAATESDRRIAKRFGREYFDGPRHLGLGGYRYNPNYFAPVVDDMIRHYGLDRQHAVLDVGCAKGFMLHDFAMALPGLRVAGCDVSDYCLEEAMPSIKAYLTRASAEVLPYPDKSFDLVVAIGSIHNLAPGGAERALREIARVSRCHAFVKVNGYRGDRQRDALQRWNLVAETILHVDDWLAMFDRAGYRGDYAWFVP
jgi:SAM-dependent methyltransferase